VGTWVLAIYVTPFSLLAWAIKVAMVINMKTAKELGLTVPPSLLRAVENLTARSVSRFRAAPS